jgi:hypothetical protein
MGKDLKGRETDRGLGRKERGGEMKGTQIGKFFIPPVFKTHLRLWQRLPVNNYIII